MGRQLASFDGITYTYDENGIRTSKTSNGVTTKYYLNGTNIIEQTDGTNTIHFYYDSSSELIGFNYDENDYFYVKNQQGDITDITNINGDIVASYAYDPWGKVIAVTGDETIGNLNPFRYRSYYYDSDIEMYYLQSRYYDANVGRFINCDDVNYIGVTESEVSYNPFAYCENEPIDYSDPSGTYYKTNFAKSWFIELINKMLGKYDTKNKQRIIDFNTKNLIVKLYLICSSGISIKNYCPFFISKGNLTMRAGDMSVTITGGKNAYSASLSFLNLTIKIAFKLAKKFIGLSISALQSVKYNITRDKQVSLALGFELLISISYPAFACMLATVIAAAYFAPYLAPVMTKVASFLTSLKGGTALSSGAKVFVRALKAIV